MVNVVAPAITLAKTVGTDPLVCATTDSIMVNAGDVVAYCYTVTNTGDIPLTMHDLDDDVLGMLLDDVAYVLAPEASFSFIVTATVDADVTNTATWTAWAGEFTAEASDTAMVYVFVPVYGVALSPDDAFTGEPGDLVTYTVTITNLGNVEDTFDLAVSGNAWTTTLPASVTLDAGASTTFEVTVLIPLTAVDGEDDVATITATSQGDNTVSDETDLTTTAEVTFVPAYEVALSPDAAFTGNSGDVVTYTVTITNLGNMADTFDLVVSGEVWTTTLSVDEVTLVAGASTTFEVVVTIPAGASHGDYDMATVTATSQGDPAATDQVVLTTRVAALNPVWLPVIQRLH
jgi:uncharacterized repeat protein (TIGR01451 family)